ncbi:MAG: PD-(D/E)XK nuclease family protein [Ilumatobacteraceae bacterium]
MTTLTTHTCSAKAAPAPSAKRPRPSVFERRQADLAERVLKLSPSSLTFLYDECKACFWHHYNGRPRPSTAFPKVFGALDNAQKEFFVGRSVKEVSRSLPAGVIERGRRVKSEAIAVDGTDYCVQFSGDTDTILRFSRAGVGVCDFKTSAPSDEAAALYGRQLHAYAFALERPANEVSRLAPVSRMGLICFPPLDMIELPAAKPKAKPAARSAATPARRTRAASARSRANYAYRTEAVWVEVERDDDAYMTFLAEVVRLIIRKTMPQSSPNCGWCRWTRMTAPLLEQTSAPLFEHSTAAVA